MNIVQILQLMYPGQVEAGNITFYMPETEILIQTWNVPGVPQPTETEVMAEEPTYQWQFDFNSLVSNSTRLAKELFDATAKSKQYDSEISCVTYASSLNPTWNAEGVTYLAWRDEVWDYLYTQYDSHSVPGTPLPTLEQLMAGVPAIVWP